MSRFDIMGDEVVWCGDRSGAGGVREVKKVQGRWDK